jgi:hypothetical protein
MRWLLFLIALVACTPAPAPTNPKPDAVEAGTGFSCETACARWAELGCEEGKPTPNGASCAEVCSNLVYSGVVELNLECRSRVAKCSEIDECERK